MHVIACMAQKGAIGKARKVLAGGAGVLIRPLLAAVEHLGTKVEGFFSLPRWPQSTGITCVGDACPYEPAYRDVVSW